MIAIEKNSKGFTDVWIQYAIKNNLAYKLVNAYDSNILSTLRTINCTLFLWHFHHNDYEASLFAKSLLKSIEIMGVNVFPNSETCWHFDDKVAQKYLLESVGAPFIDTYIFYDKKSALGFLESDNAFPKVFKLRGGAGSSAVKLIKSETDYIKEVGKMFSKGIGREFKYEMIKDRWGKFILNKSFTSALGLASGIAKLFINNEAEKKFGIEFGYFYIQKFIPDLDCDYRIIVIGKKAFFVKRLLRGNDFRASGSGKIVYELGTEERRSLPIQEAFELTNKLKSQCCAFDFVNYRGNWKLIEVSYGFSPRAYDKCQGYWDQNLKWHSNKVEPERFILESIL